METIVAVSSGRPPAAIAVIRVSGADALAAAEVLAGPLPPAREARVRPLRGPDGALLDRAIVLVFPGPGSATGEDLVELHCHGGRAVVDAVERALLARPGARRAEAGEFTRRALLNGRIDLAQAEGLADLLAAETERQRRAAITAAEGRISASVRGWIDEAALIAAELEAQLDFSDEDDVAQGGAAFRSLLARMGSLGERIGAEVERPPVDRVRDGIRVVLAGPPNSGKSTLINALSDREIAIVTPVAGTTRDRIEASVSRGGIAYVLTDTAGLTQSEDQVERIGVVRAGEAIDTADILLWMGDYPPPRPALWLHARADAPGRTVAIAGTRASVAASDADSVERVWDLIEEQAQHLLPAESALAFSRWQQAQCRAAAMLLRTDAPDELIAAELVRGALTLLTAILGVGATEAMLNALFDRFCIGK